MIMPIATIYQVLIAGTVVRVSIKTAVGVTSGRWVHPGEFRRKPL